jgi:hydrogenase-4 component E
MNAAVDPLLVLILVVNFFAMGTSRLRALITASAIQGLLIGSLTAAVHGNIYLRGLLITVGAILLKGIIIPSMLGRAMRDLSIHREIEPFIGYVTSLLLCALGTGLSLLYARTLPLAPEHQGSLLVPAALATVLTGFILLTSRKKAITQVVGYLVLENGVFIMGLTLVNVLPFLVEAGVLLDLFVGVFVMGIMIHHINREFASIDTSNLAKLRD